MAPHEGILPLFFRVEDANVLEPRACATKEKGTFYFSPCGKEK